MPRLELDALLTRFTSVPKADDDDFFELGGTGISYHV